MDKDELARFKYNFLNVEFEEYKKSGQLITWIHEQIPSYVEKLDEIDDEDLIGVLELIVNQVCRNIHVGSDFVDAILENHLTNAIVYGDPIDRVCLCVYVLYVQNMIPAVIMQDYRIRITKR
jgi:hypothetical protein